MFLLQALETNSFASLENAQRVNSLNLEGELRDEDENCLIIWQLHKFHNIPESDNNNLSSLDKIIYPF